MAVVSADPPATSPDPLTALPPGYAALLTRLRDVAASDPRVRALWVGGSVGRGVADAGSDLDLVVTVADDAMEAFVAEGPEVWSAAVDPVITLAIPGLPGAYAFTSRDALRCDVVVEPVRALATAPSADRVVVLDPDGLAGRLAVGTPSPSGPDVAGMGRVVQEFLRQTPVFPAAVVAREDWLLGQEAVHSYRTMLYELFAESNAPHPPMGIKQWSARLTPEQRAVLAALPLPSADRDSVIEAMALVRAALRTHGRAAYERVGGVWPGDVAAAVDTAWSASGLPG